MEDSKIFTITELITALLKHANLFEWSVIALQVSWFKSVSWENQAGGDTAQITDFAQI